MYEKEVIGSAVGAGTMVMSMAACGGKDSWERREDVVNVAVLLKPESN